MAYSETCSCGRIFTTPGALKNHQNVCTTNKKQLSTVLENAKKLLATRRAERLQALAIRKEQANVCVPSCHNLNTQSELHLHSTSAAGSVTGMSQCRSLIDDSEPRPSKRRRIAPARYPGLVMYDKRLCDILPQAAPALLPSPALPSKSPAAPPIPLASAQNFSTLDIRQSLVHDSHVQSIETAHNVFGIFRRYHGSEFPSHDPEHEINLSMLSNIPTPPAETPSQTASTKASDFYPYPNENSFLLGEWYWNQGSQKSQDNFRKLLDIVGNTTFSAEDICQTKWAQINRQLAVNDWDAEEWVDEDAGWQKSDISIRVPFHRFLESPGVRDYTVPNFYHRSLTSVIRERLKKDADNNCHFHFEPFELLWKPNLSRSTCDLELGADGLDSTEVRLHGELYTSPAFVAAHRELQTITGEPNCDLPRVVVGLMFWSDGTLLTTYGNAKLWPLYMAFGNDSKYQRCKPSSNLYEHVAYFEQLPDEFKDFAGRFVGKKKLTRELLAHCHRELMHKQWTCLLDDDFLYAYEHGIVMDCGDGLQRRFYPRIFTYSADYPEKVLMASIRNMGGCPCPRCKISINDISLVGMASDRRARRDNKRLDDAKRQKAVLLAREAIFQKNFAVDSAYVERQLKDESLVPSFNAFSDRLSRFGFNLFTIFPVDLMHEIELGIWRALLVHLLRMLESVHENCLHEFDKRFRQVPTFGRDTIRRFSANSSELKRMAAWNFEDFLQCSIPVFEGLLPEPHNAVILQLLFYLAHWHGLAKLRMHHDITLAILDKETTVLGRLLRSFSADTCPQFKTKELRREAEARQRLKAKADQGSSKPQPVRKPRCFNLNTYKTHALGDYVETIKTYGTTDSYSTEPGELEHRSPKARYKRTSKKGFKQQLAQIERRQARIKRINEKSTGKKKDLESKLRGSHYNDPAVHHHIGVGENEPLHLGAFCREHVDDPAVRNFHLKLREHLASRMNADLQNASEQPAELPDPDVDVDVNLIFFKNDLVYKHNVLRINYTTYDVRRAQDSINPHTEHRDIMLLANGSQHQYRYARVLGIYHTNVIYTGRGRGGKVDHHSQRMEFLWVRWFETVGDKTVQQGWQEGMLDELKFHRITSEDAFGFVDPGDILRGCHLIPRFLLGKSRGEEARPRSICAQEHKDWRSYYANRFVDRDMLMRYHWSLGVGHLYSRISGLREPIAVGLQQLIDDNTGDLPSIPESSDFNSKSGGHQQSLAGGFQQASSSTVTPYPVDTSTVKDGVLSQDGSHNAQVEGNCQNENLGEEERHRDFEGCPSLWLEPRECRQSCIEGQESPTIISITDVESMHSSYRHERTIGNCSYADDEDDYGSVNLGEEDPVGEYEDDLLDAHECGEEDDDLRFLEDMYGDATFDDVAFTSYD